MYSSDHNHGPFVAVFMHASVRTGGKDLKASSAYPADFGKRVCALHNEWLVGS